MYVADWVDMSGYLTLPLDAFSWRSERKPEQLDTTGELVVHWAADETAHEAPFWTYATLDAAATLWTVDWFRTAKAGFVRTSEQTALGQEMRGIVGRAIGCGDNDGIARGAERLIAAAVRKDEDIFEEISPTPAMGGAITLATAIPQQSSRTSVRRAVAQACDRDPTAIQRAEAAIEDVLPKSFCSVLLEPQWMPASARYGASAKPVSPTKILRRTR